MNKMPKKKSHTVRRLLSYVGRGYLIRFFLVLVCILVSAVATASALELRVRDYGPGLPVSSRGNEQVLFDKFTRGQAESSTRGVGLGLAICKTIVEAHRGSIRAENADGGGAAFVMTLPRTPPPESPDMEDAEIA